MPTYDLSYDTMERVIDSWEKIRAMKNYEQLVGKALFQHLFTRCPEAKAIFGFSQSTLSTSMTPVYDSKPFLAQACVAISMLDANISMLGTDMELIHDNLLQLSEQFARFNNKSSTTTRVLAVLGDSLFMTLEELLNTSDFTKQDRDAWLHLYRVLYKIVEKQTKKLTNKA